MRDKNPPWVYKWVCYTWEKIHQEMPSDIFDHEDVWKRLLEKVDTAVLCLILLLCSGM